MSDAVGAWRWAREAHDARRHGPATFLLCQDLVGPGGVIANIGVHGQAVELHLERLWARNVAITTRLVDTVSTPMLLKTVRAKKIDPGRLITHRFPLAQIVEAYDIFGVPRAPRR